MEIKDKLSGTVKITSIDGIIDINLLFNQFHNTFLPPSGYNDVA